MALKSWLASLKPDVSGVSDVQAPIDAGLGRYVTDTADVSGVSGSGGMVAIDTAETADTAANNQTYQAQPAWALGCTGDTADTCKLIDTEANAANELISGDLLTGWNVTIPHGITAATLAKFRAASLALDASIVAAGGSLELPRECRALRQATTGTTAAAASTDDPKRGLPLGRQRGPWLTEREQSSAAAYNRHHFNCPQCIAAGRGERYGGRCAVGLALWIDYNGTDDLQTEGAHHGQA